jgi:heme/copper-type cytochrome/quinol oxidase subunit 2
MKPTHWLLFAVAIVALTGLYVLARPPTAAVPEPSAPAPVPVAAAPPSAPPEVTAREFIFDVVQGKLTGPPHLQVNQNERVILRVTSDVADELHVHGYELSAPLPAGEPVSLTFIAAKSGRFEVELHGAHRQLGALEVQPR